jgi:hypothetical protein
MKKERGNMKQIHKKTFFDTNLKVDMNYKTGRRGENNCRIVSAGSDLDRLYQKVYDDYFGKSTNIAVIPIDEDKGFTEQEQINIERDGSGEWILS